MKKKIFLDVPSEQNTSWQMSAADVSILAKYYNKKHRIKIFKNGDTSLGKELIKKNQEKIKPKLGLMQSPDEKYINCVQELGFLFPSPLNVCLIGEPANNRLWLILSPIQKKLTDNVPLSPEEIKHFNQLLADSEFKNLLDIQIKNIIEETKAEIDDICLFTDQAEEEIKHIQQTLKDNETVGYIYTQRSQSKCKHFEVLTLTKDVAIRPVSWGFADMLHVPNEFKVAFDTILKSEELDRPPCAQADQSACGTLGFMYTRELLKKDAIQLKEYTLSFCFYNQRGTLQPFFYPSPHVLRYSQSTFYNTLIHKMLEDDEKPQRGTYKDKSYQLETLKGLLIQSIAIAKEKNDKKIITSNTEILENLENFRKKWLSAYAKSNLKRERMFDSSGVNRYLTYTTKRMEKISEDARASIDTKIRTYTLNNTYKYCVSNQQGGRFHFYTVSASNFQLGRHFGNMKGDYLKTKILERFKGKIEQTQSLLELEEQVQRIKKSNEYKVLKKAQGLFTKITGIKTSSIKAFERMCDDQKNNFNTIDQKP